MKASEVKIGNWVEDLDPSHLQFVVTKIERNETMSFINGRWDEDVVPIPLTEAWLKKFGFRKTGEHGEYEKDGFQMQDVHHVWFSRDNDGYHQGLVDVKHVHQLQNIYHALTGHELISKTNKK